MTEFTTKTNFQEDISHLFLNMYHTFITKIQFELFNPEIEHPQIP